MTRTLDIIHSGLKILLGALIVGLLIPVTMQILSRYGGLLPRYIWTEEIARFCFVWMIIIGAICAVRDGSHFDVDVLPASANPNVEALKSLFAHFSIIAVGIVFVWYGVAFIKFGWFQTSEIFELPMNYIFVAWPVAGVLFVIFEIERLLPAIRQLTGANR